MKSNQIQSILYHIKQTDLEINVIVKDESIWATQKAIAELFGVNVPAINKHLNNIYKEHELDEMATISKMEIVQVEGSREVARIHTLYNLDAIISVGYRVNSKEATRFRIWATNILKEYTIKGYTLNREQLEQGNKIFGKDYFKDLLETIRSIRASERRIYQQITDIFAECSLDYDPHSPITREFFAFIQNRFHYAITGKTAPEIIYAKADASLPNMGLTTWKNSPEGRILKSDTEIAKNYLSEEEIKKLERLIGGYFDYIEDLVERENTFTMEEFKASVDKFLNFRDYKILHDNGKISRAQAIEKASSEYEIFNKTQKIKSDFDKVLKALQKESK
ncbi:cell filamentation protein Fic [Helicobacter sp. TUL]|uniref:virulence RhuM family protein n=1 Tax=Helicobacter sp. TUL TaxID=1848928 RepID=UPI000BAB87C9|nr:virulence RhuM family protein [Helicobacter sp. TUL]PAU99607.1 cell filamentation protein Fic [Helicobacter sp. TUL]